MALLVTGAMGHVGQEVVRHAAAAGAPSLHNIGRLIAIAMSARSATT